MKKLYLSSMDIPNADALLGLMGKHPEKEDSAALLINARDRHEEHLRVPVIEDRVNLFGSLGMKTNVVDLRDYSKEGSELKRELSSVRLIWTLRGNTFILRDLMRKSGFEDIVDDLLQSGITYGGDSAGTLAAGRSIGGINLEASDPPELAAETIEDGLRLVPYIVVPHYGHPDFAELTRGADEHPDQSNILRLTDHQAAIFTGGNYKIVEAA